MKIQGRVKEILKAETFNSKTGTEFTKQTVLITMGDNYPVHLPVDFFQDKISLVENIKEDQELTVHINFKSNEYKGKYYVSIQGWKIDTENQQETPKSFAKADKETENQYTDLPF